MSVCWSDPKHAVIFLGHSALATFPFRLSHRKVCYAQGIEPTIWVQVAPDTRAQPQVDKARRPQAAGLGRAVKIRNLVKHYVENLKIHQSFYIITLQFALR